LVALLACVWIDDPTLNDRFDPDGDGVAWPEDCDDSDPYVYDPLVFYADADGDGYGSRDEADAIESCESSVEGYVTNNEDCDDDDANATPDAIWFEDADGDGYGGSSTTEDCEEPEGYVAESGDCNDGDASFSPGVEESCNDDDDDCDGLVDEDVELTVWYPDSDSDGFGVDFGQIEGCAEPPGDYSEVSGDCDDLDSDVHPEADEYCDGIDNDCDFAEDEDDAVDADTWYRDEDGDGYGDAKRTSVACDQPDGFVDNADDCDDDAAAAYPGGVELWYDGLDGDCDGGSDADADGDGYDYDLFGGEDCDDSDAAVSPAATELWYDGVDQDCDGASDYDADGDGEESSAFGGEDCDDADAAVGPGATETWYDGVDADCDLGSDYDADGDGYDSQDHGFDDCDDTDAAVNPGAEEIWYDGFDSDCDGADDYDADGDGHGSDAYGYADCDDTTSAVSPDADEVCGDRLDNDCDGTATGCELPAELDLASEADAMLLGTAGGDFAGWSVAGAGDHDGDGGDELVVGAYGYNGSASATGAAFVVFGADVDQSVDEGVSLVGTDQDDYAGRSVTGGTDVDGDGWVDLLIGATGVDDGASSGGGAYLVLGPATADSALGDATLLYGDSENASAGNAVGLGELTGDGYGDVVVGAPGDDAVYLLSGPVTGGALSEGWALSGGSESGYSLAVLGDIDGDGIDDLAIGAYLDSSGGSYAGVAYVVQGPVTSDLDLDADAVAWTGESSNDFAGIAVGAPGDLDGDGLADAAVGAYGESTGGSFAGAAYVLAGPATAGGSLSGATAKLTGESASDAAGTALGGGIDADEDDDDELLVGARANDAGGTDAGAAYLLLGPVSGTSSLADADSVMLGSAGDNAGYSVAGVGDIEGNGYGDVAVGAYLEGTAGGSAGAVYVVVGLGL